MSPSAASRLLPRLGGGWRLPALAILLLAFFLRLHLLGESPIWWDEGLAVWAARQSLSEIAAWTSRDVHPPLYFWLLHGWLPLVGESEFAVRWLSAALGTLTVAVLFTLGRALVSGSGARAAVAIPLLGALLVATSRFHIWWSQEARMYVLGSLLVTLSLWLTYRLRQRFTWPRALTYLLVTSAALWTLYLLAFLLVIEGLFWLATLPRRGWGRSLVAWMGLQGVVLLSFLPWLGYALPRMQRWSVQVPFDGDLFARLYLVLLTLGISTDVDRVLPVAGATVIVVVVGCLLAWRQGGWRPGLLLLTSAVLIPPLAVALATLTPRSFGYSPKPEARYFAPYGPLFALLLGWAIATIASHARRLRPLAGVGLTVLSLGMAGWALSDYYNARYLVDDYRSVAATLRAYVRQGDGVLLHSDQPWPVFAYHWPGPWQGISHIAFVSDSRSLAPVRAQWAAHEGLWLVVNEDAQRIDSERQVEKLLTSEASATRTWRFGAKRLIFFARSPQRAEALDELAAGSPAALLPPSPVMGRGAGALSAEIPLRRYRPGEVAHLFVNIPPISEPITLTVGLGPADAPLTAQTLAVAALDRPERLQFDLLIPPNAPTGDQPWLLSDGQATYQLGQASVLPGGRRAEEVTLPPDVTPTRVTVADPPLLTLEGYGLHTPAVAPGETVHVTLFWRAERPMVLPYKVFVHLVEADNTRRGQMDSEPVNGTRPTPSWLPGELIPDPYAITVAADAPPGRYTLIVGLYDAATGQRLGPVRDAGGTLQPGEIFALTTVEVR